MRARSSVKLVLASAVPMALAACSHPDDTVTVRNNYKSVQACVDAKVPVDVCSDAYMQALADHRKIAPTYDDQAACDADFVPGYCDVTSDGKYMPKMGGFELAMSGSMPKAGIEQANAQAAQSGHGGDSGFINGLLWGQLLSNNNNNYYSQPIYDTRDNRGGYASSTLSRQIDLGKKFGASTQARGSSSASYTNETLGRSLGSGADSGRSRVSSAISRGGFGQQATARSGWSGKSSSSFGSGG